MAQPQKSIAVIGAGILGVSTAIWLQRAGHNVSLIDREGPAAGTSFGNGGVLAACASIPVTVPGLMAKAPFMLFDANAPLFLKWRYLPKLVPWLVKYMSHANEDDVRRIANAVHALVGDSLEEHQLLSEGTQAARHVVPNDYIYLYKDRAHFNGDALGWKIRKELGFEWDELEGNAFNAFDPSFAANLRFAAKMGNHGRITDPGQYVKDLAAHFVKSGGELLKANIDDFDCTDGRVIALRTKDGPLTFDDYVLTTGIWSKPLAEKLGVNVPMESERGYHVELWEPNMMPKVPVMHAGGKFVITPMEGRIRLAGIVEFGGLKAPASKPPFDLLLRNIKAAMPNLTWQRTETWMGHRPAPSDSIPIIGPSPNFNNAWMAFGHHHIGLTGGAKTGRLLAQMMGGAVPNLDLAPYSPMRFSKG